MLKSGRRWAGNLMAILQAKARALLAGQGEG